jgi:hypothetical protein
MALTDLNSLVLAQAGQQAMAVYKASVTGQTTGTVASLWRATGTPVQAAIPGAAAVVDRLKLGALPVRNLLGPATSKYLGAWALASSVQTVLALVDRLIESGNLNGTLTTAQAVNTPALPAAPRLLASEEPSTEWYLEFYTATGATAVSATVAVTYNGANGTGNVVVALAASRPAGFMQRILPAIPGAYIVSIQSVTLSATTGAAGAFGVTCLRRLGLVAAVVASGIADRAAVDPRPVPVDACLSFICDLATTSTGVVAGFVSVMDG